MLTFSYHVFNVDTYGGLGLSYGASEPDWPGNVTYSP